MMEAQQHEIHSDSYRRSAINIVRDVFLTMLGTSTVEAAGPSGNAGAQVVVGAVHFAGGWTGAVLLQCEQRQAFEFASLLTGIPRPDEVNDDVRDTMGEIVNMIAGNLKSTLPASTALSMPSVVEGRDFSFRVLGGSSSLPIYFSSDHGLFSVTLVQVAGD